MLNQLTTMYVIVSQLIRVKDQVLTWCLREQQTRALGESFVDTHFTAIYISDLKRAFSTAQVLYGYQKDPRPSFDSGSTQFFIIALTKFVLPHVWQAGKEGKTDGVHVAIGSHGLCLSESISELLEMGANKGRRTGHGLSNAGWTRVVINAEVGS
ncbi:hypothetical protein H4582DRAFT_1900761 [Lactarius indigo]|nr:hypothetical protein H4582DRAFT_1900761 [Lactarius indigo]